MSRRGVIIKAGTELLAGIVIGCILACVLMSRFFRRATVFKDYEMVVRPDIDFIAHFESLLGCGLHCAKPRTRSVFHVHDESLAVLELGVSYARSTSAQKSFRPQR